MEHRRTYGYMYIGTAVRYLMDIAPTEPIFAPATLRENIVELDRLLTDYEFHVTSRLAYGITNLVAEWDSEAETHDNDDDWKDTRRLTQEEHRKVTTDASHIRETMLAEAMGKMAFIASDSDTRWTS